MFGVWGAPTEAHDLPAFWASRVIARAEGALKQTKDKMRDINTAPGQKPKEVVVAPGAPADEGWSIRKIP